MTNPQPYSRWRSRRTWQSLLLAMAALWSIGLLVGAVTLPSYHSATISAEGHLVNGTKTLVDVNGASVLYLVAIPLAAVVVVGLLLMLRRRLRRYGAGALAWSVVGVLGAFTFLAMMTIGIFIVPVVVLLVLACAAAPLDRLRFLPAPPTLAAGLPPKR